MIKTGDFPYCPGNDRRVSPVSFSSIAAARKQLSRCRNTATFHRKQHKKLLFFNLSTTPIYPFSKPVIKIFTPIIMITAPAITVNLPEQFNRFARNLPKTTHTPEITAVVIPIALAGSQISTCVNAILPPMASASRLVATAGKNRLPNEKNSPNGQEFFPVPLSTPSRIILPPTMSKSRNAR